MKAFDLLHVPSNTVGVFPFNLFPDWGLTAFWLPVIAVTASWVAGRVFVGLGVLVDSFWLSSESGFDSSEFDSCCWSLNQFLGLG